MEGHEAARKRLGPERPQPKGGVLKSRQDAIDSFISLA